MIFYLTHNPTRLHPTQADAKAISKNFEQIDIPTSKPELMKFVQELYDQIDAEVVPAGGEFPEEAVNLTPSYVHQSVDIDETFDTFPLARQLDLAARAMENARERL